MKSKLSPAASTALAGLAEAWPKLENDVERAMAIQSVAKLNVSTRVLARQLGYGATHIRNLLLMAKASSEDQLFARRGEISLRELVRRSKVADARRNVADREALDRKRTKAAQEGCRVICYWLEEEELWSSHCEDIINETRRMLYEAEREGTLPQGPFPQPGTPVTEIIQMCRPKPDPQEIAVARYARWLASWSYYAFPDTDVRDRALNLALNEQIRRN